MEGPPSVNPANGFADGRELRSDDSRFKLFVGRRLRHTLFPVSPDLDLIRPKVSVRGADVIHFQVCCHLKPNLGGKRYRNRRVSVSVAPFSYRPVYRHRRKRRAVLGDNNFRGVDYHRDCTEHEAGFSPGAANLRQKGIPSCTPILPRCRIGGPSCTGAFGDYPNGRGLRCS